MRAGRRPSPRTPPMVIGRAGRGRPSRDLRGPRRRWRPIGVGLRLVPVRGPGCIGLPGRRRLGRRGCVRRDRGCAAPPDDVQADGRRRVAPVAGLDDEQVMAANVDVACSSPGSTTTSTSGGSNASSPWPGRAGSGRSSSSTSRTSRTTWTGGVVAVEAVAPGVAIVPVRLDRRTG